MIIPAIHNNGTGKDELIRQICAAKNALDDALTALAIMSPNKRDYYIVGNYTDARNEHAARIDAIKKMRDELEDAAWKISEQ